LIAVATVESKLCDLALMRCRSASKLQLLLGRQLVCHEMSVVSDLRLAARVSAPKSMPPSTGSVREPVSSAPFAS
jgi:hypothetical protein